MNILFLTALKAEAQSIISHYNLVKNNTSHIYSNGNVFLFIIGVGNKKVLNRLKSFVLNYNQWESTTIINIGIAGGNQLDVKLGEIYRVSSIVDQHSGRIYLPDILLKSIIDESDLTTVLKPINNKPVTQRGLIDMEASTIFQFMSKYVPPHRLNFLKIVSDYMDTSVINNLKINRLIKIQMNKVLLFIDEINNLELLDRNVLDQEEKQIIQKIIRNLKLTETQQYQLLELSENRKKLKNNLEVLEVFLSQKTNNKKERNELFNAIREQISS